MNRQRSTRGASLVEVVTAIVVLGVALPPLAALFSEVAATSPDQTFRQVALNLAESLMEEIGSKAFEDPDLSPGSFGTEEGQRLSYDDVDDYDGLNNSPPRHFDGRLLDDHKGFTRSVFVVNVTAADPDAIVPEADASTHFKRIQVTVAWSGARGGVVRLSTLRTRLEGGGAPKPGPLDVVASADSALRLDRFYLSLNLVSISPNDEEIESFSLSSDAPSGLVWRLWLENQLVWAGFLISLPTGVLPLNVGSSADRTVRAGARPRATLLFWPAESGTVEYTLDLNFVGGATSTIKFTIDW